MKCGTAKVQQSSGLSGMSELIPLWSPRHLKATLCFAKGAQESVRIHTGKILVHLIEKCLSVLLDPALKAGKEYLLLETQLGARTALCLTPEKTPSHAPTWSDKLRLTKAWSIEVLFVFLQELNSDKQRSFCCFLLAWLFICPCVLLGDHLWLLFIQSCPELLNNTSCPQQESMWPDGDVHLAAGGRLRAKYLPVIAQLVEQRSKGHMSCAA